MKIFKWFELPIYGALLLITLTEAWKGNYERAFVVLFVLFIGMPLAYGWTHNWRSDD